MSLYGSIKEVQRTTEKFYLKLEQRFRGNKLIAELWSQMAQDVSQQIVNLHDLPKSFWIHLKKDQHTLLKTIQTEVTPQNIKNASELSLSDCIESAIRSEEAIILKIYVPIIRNLRKNWTGQSLDFYIMVKAHAVRIKRVAEAFSGDPVVLQLSSLLFQRFEKEIQEPEVEVILKKRRARKIGGSRAKKAKKPQQKAKTKVKSKAASKPKTPAKTKAKPKAASKTKTPAKTKVKLKAASKTKTPAKTKAKPKAASKAKTSAKTKVKLKAASKVKTPAKTKAKPKAASKPKTPTKTKAKPKAASKPKTPTKTKAKPKAASKPKTTTKTKAKLKAASKPKTTTKTKVKPKAASKPKTTTKTKVKPKAASKPKTPTKTKAKPKAASKAKTPAKKSTKQKRSLAGRSKTPRSHSKPLVKKTSLRRSRARR